MTDSRLTPQFKYITMLCCQNRDIFSICRPTVAISVHKKDQHVQGWKPTSNFSRITKIIKNGSRKKLIKN